MAQIVKRRGKDLTLNWAIKTNGAETALAGRDLTLVRTSPCGHSVKMTWTSEGNKLIFHFRGRKQVECGSYKFTLWENLGKNGQSVVDCTDQLQLVESTELEQEGNADNLEVESVDLTSADVVLGAKGADGRGIVSMVQTLSSTASGGKNAVTVTYTDGTTAVFEFYNGAQGEDADIEGCEEAISSANDARDEALAQVEACKAELATLRNDYTTKYQALANDYAGVKASLTSAYNSELATLRSDYSDVKGALQTDYRTTKSSLSSDYTAKANALASRYAELQTALQTDYNDKLTTLNSQYTADVNAIKNRYDAEVTSAKASMETKLSQIQTACNNAIGAVNTKLVEYNSDHDTAVSDHSIANADHNTALSDHNIASTDHNTASTDHNTASADHATAVSDHSKVSGAEKVNAAVSSDGKKIVITGRDGVSKEVAIPEGGGVSDAYTKAQTDALLRWKANSDELDDLVTKVGGFADNRTKSVAKSIEDVENEKADKSALADYPKNIYQEDIYIEIDSNDGITLESRSSDLPACVTIGGDGGQGNAAFCAFSTKNIELEANEDLLLLGRRLTFNYKDVATEEYVDNKWQISDTKCGALSDLTTTTKTSLVASINEINNKIGNIEPSLASI